MNDCLPLTILIVDDCDEDRNIYRHYLKYDRFYTYEIVEFTKAKHAITWCQQQIPDVILLDYLLPDDDGLEVLQQLRKNLNNSQSAVIMLTGQGDETIAVRAMKYGAQDYLVKNYLTPETLQNAIHYAVERMQLTRQLEQSRQQQQLMAAIALRIRQSLKLEEILAVTTKEVQQFLKADRVIVYQFHPDMSGCVVAESVLPDLTATLGVEIQEKYFAQGAVADCHQIKNRMINDIYQANLTDFDLQLLEQFEVKANLVVPILVTNQLWGLLIVNQCHAPREWQPFELELLDQLAVQIAIAIQQASAYAQAQTELQERKRIEATLRQKEERLSLALEAANMGNWDWNIQTGEIHWSENLEKLFGMQPGTFQGRYEIFVEMIHPEDRQQVLQAINQAIYHQEDYNIEFRFIKPDGTLRWALSRGKVFYDHNGHPLRMSGVDFDITERRQAEVDLQESEARFQAFMNNSPSVSWITDNQGQVVYMSETYLRTFQLPFDKLEDFRGKTVFDVYPPEIAQPVLDNIHQVIQTQQILETVEQAPRADGTIGDFLVYKFPLPGKSGQLLVGGVAIDITDKIHAEQALQELNQELEARVAERTAALRESEERWHLALRGSNDGIWDRNIKTNEVFFSTRWEEMLGFSKHELSQNRESWSNCIHPEDQERVMQAIADHLNHKTPFFQEEYRVQRKDSTYIWVLDRGQALWDEVGNPIRMSGSATDITQRKQTEAQLLAVTGLQQAILASIDYAIMSTNSEGIIQTFNLAAQKMLGYTDTEVIGKLTPNSFHDPEELQQRMDALAREMGREMTPQDFSVTKIQQETYEEEWTFIRKDGSRFPVALSVKPLCNAEGQIIGGVGIAKDITQQKQIENQLRKNAASLTAAQRIAHLGSWELNLQTQNLIWSEEVFRIFGRHPHSGTPSYEEMQNYIHPDDRDHRDFVVQQAIAHGQAYETEYRFYRADGSLGYLLSRGEVILDTYGQPYQLIGTILDITERKQAEAALRESEHRYATLTEAAPVAIFRLDAASNCIYVNERWSLMTGRPTQAALGKGWLENIHEEDQNYLLMQCPGPCGQKCYLNEACRREVKYLRPDGQINWFYIQIVPETNPSGKIIGYIGTLTDITTRKQIESEVIHHRDLREAIFNESADALFLVDIDTQLIFDCNRRAIELFEAENKAELLNIQGNELQRYQFSLQEWEENIQEFHEKSYWSREIEYVTRKGNFFWGHLAAKQISVADKVMNLVRLSDISDRKKAVEQIQRSLEEKETLLKEIHHRVKNNLQIISSLLRMQSRRSFDETILLLFKESQNRVQSMALIHEQLYQSADIHQINFGNYIKSLTDNLFRCYGISQKNIAVNIETNGIKLTLDNAIPCGLIINELISNCLKYAFPEQKTGEITISLTQSSDNQLSLIVKDTGVGIPANLDWENTNSLGLRIVKNLVRQIKGNVILNCDRGTTFYINFPP